MHSCAISLLPGPEEKKLRYIFGEKIPPPIFGCNLTFGYTKLHILKKLYLLFLKEHIFIKFFCQFAKVCHWFKEKKTLCIIIFYSCTFTPWSLSLAKNQFHQPFGLKTAHFPISYNNYENNYFPPFIMF